MPTMEVFNNPFFSAPVLSAAIEMTTYQPQYLGSLGIFDVQPINGRAVWVARRGNSLVMVPTSPIGAPPRHLDPETTDAVPLKTTRLAKGFTMYAVEVEGLRPFGNQSALMTVQAEYLRRLARVQADLELTEEFHRLGAVQGVLLDADGTSVIYDFFDEFGIPTPATVMWDLENADFDPIAASIGFARPYVRSSRGAITTTSRIHALAGDEFYDRLVRHPFVEAYYTASGAAQARIDAGTPFESFTFRGITYHNYRGTDDNTTIAIPADEAKVFPVGAGIFTKAQSPAEFEPFIGTMGRESYALNIPDRDRNAFTTGEVYRYPLYFCNRPDLLRTFKIGT